LGTAKTYKSITGLLRAKKREDKMVKLGQSGTYLNSGDVSSGDMVVFKNEGEWQTSNKFKYKNADGTEGEFKRSFVIAVDFKGAELLMRVNKTSRDALVVAYGDDTATWVGKQAKITKEHSRQIQADVLYLEPVNGAPSAKKEAEAIWDDA
jgi:hypothetical protein